MRRQWHMPELDCPPGSDPQQQVGAAAGVAQAGRASAEPTPAMAGLSCLLPCSAPACAALRCL